MITGVAVRNGWNSARLPFATLIHGSTMTIAKIAIMRMPPAVCTQRPMRKPTIVSQTSAPTTIAVVGGDDPAFGHERCDAGPEDVAQVLRELQADVGHVEDREDPQVPRDDEPHELVEAELRPLIQSAFERHDLVEPDGDTRRREVEERDGDEPEDDVGRSLFRGDADPLQADDEEDLREDEVAKREVLAEGFATGLNRCFPAVERSWRDRRHVTVRG